MTIYENQIKAIHSAQQIWIESLRSQIEITAPITRIPSELVSFFWMTQENLKHDAKAQTAENSSSKEKKPAVKRPETAPRIAKKPTEIVKADQGTKTPVRKAAAKPPLTGVADIRVKPKPAGAKTMEQNGKTKKKG